MMKVESLLVSLDTNTSGLQDVVQMEELLRGTDDLTRSVIEAGLRLLRTEGLEPAADFVSANMSAMRMESRARLNARIGSTVLSTVDQGGEELALAD
ncbi:hypothetical protein [Lacisediminimonas profundi]|uniref:hypothetical protein n=1 Tax=Lacisediminimonas profundi TaxID=2603856 RepID=UPI00124B6BE4|nr:hypothetical protein [Lacisediminimonas profundi]